MQPHRLPGFGEESQYPGPSHPTSYKAFIGVYETQIRPDGTICRFRGWVEGRTPPVPDNPRSLIPTTPSYGAKMDNRAPPWHVDFSPPSAQHPLTDIDLSARRNGRQLSLLLRHILRIKRKSGRNLNRPIHLPIRTPRHHRPRPLQPPRIPLRRDLPARLRPNPPPSDS